MTPIRERRERARTLKSPRHRGTDDSHRFSAGFAALGGVAYAGAQVSASAIDLNSGSVLVAIDDRIVLPTASIGTLLLLIEVSARMTADQSAGYAILDRSPADEIRGSGLLQHLRVPALPLADLAVLVASGSDNLATNLLLRHVGLQAVRARAESLGLTRTALLDFARVERGPDDAPQASVAAASELTWLITALFRGQVVDRATSRRVLGWLRTNTDLSMVASAFGLDPLDHGEPEHGLRLVNTTGTDVGVRSEVGVLEGPRAGVAYALTIRFADTSTAARLAVLDAMRIFGTDLLEFVG